MRRRAALLALGSAAGALGGCALGSSQPRRISFEAGPFVKAVRALDKGAQAHYRSTVGMVALAQAAVKAQKLRLPDGVSLTAYVREAGEIKAAWDKGVDTIMDTVATAKADALFDSEALKGFAEAVVPLAELAMKLLPLLAAVAL